VVVGYFYQERPMLEIAAELGVTESRVSQLRAEALILLRDGLNAHLDPDTVPPSPRLEGRVAKRRAAYHAAIGACSDFRARASTRRHARCWTGGCFRLRPWLGNGFARSVPAA
jgi:RNA polymerase sigma factor for flagellar operon FliA